MNEQITTVHPGDILMDSTTFEDAFNTIYHGVKSPSPPNRRYLSGLIQLVQALVLHNRILIEPSSYDVHMRGGLSEYLQDLDLCNLVEPIWLSGQKLKRLEFRAARRAVEIMPLLSDEAIGTLARCAMADPKTYYDSKRMVRYALPVECVNGERKYDDPDYLRVAAAEAIAYRAYLYLAISYEEELPYLPNVYRVPLIEHELRTKLFYKKTVDAAMKKVEQAAMATIRHRNQLIGQSIFRLEFPPVFNYILSQVKASWREIIPRTLELRESREAKGLRKMFTKLDRATREGDFEPLAKVLDDIQARSKVWLKQIDEPSIDISVAFPLGIEFNPVGLWTYARLRRKRHLFFLDKLYVESAKSSHLWPKVMALGGAQRYAAKSRIESHDP